MGYETQQQNAPELATTTIVTASPSALESVIADNSVGLNTSNGISIAAFDDLNDYEAEKFRLMTKASHTLEVAKALRSQEFETYLGRFDKLIDKGKRFGLRTGGTVAVICATMYPVIPHAYQVMLLSLTAVAVYAGIETANSLGKMLKKNRVDLLSAIDREALQYLEALRKQAQESDIPVDKRTEYFNHLVATKARSLESEAQALFESIQEIYPEKA